LERQPVPSVAHKPLNRVEAAAPREQLAPSSATGGSPAVNHSGASSVLPSRVTNAEPSHITRQPSSFSDINHPVGSEPCQSLRSANTGRTCHQPTNNAR
jgi:hypothetical protein